MEVSTFELLVKRIAPKSALPLPEQAVARRVVQGYFLTISNLETKDLRYRLEFKISLPDNPAQPDAGSRVLEGNTALIYDIAGNNTFLSLTRVGTTGRYVSQEFTVPAQKTISVELLPDVAKFAMQAEPLLEVRGFVSLFLPRDFSGSTLVEKIFGKPQSAQPVNVLLNAEIRGTFLPNDYPDNPNSADFDQINYSLSLASGKALNQIPSDPPRILFPGSSGSLEITPGTLKTASDVPDVTQADINRVLAEVMAMASNGNGNGNGIEAVNRSLAALNLPVRMSM